ncbi:putative beta-glucosidase A [Venturia nashicola]|uniref:Putative beta-glucosidase A n=1 Tax=Venturia nashicola TaxID=86259 RepID=A0A4Z1P4V1_9PEZI|nr:putative beta-glucosidase A [Venturia nashicola]
MSHDGNLRKHEAIELQRIPSTSTSSEHSTEAEDDEYELTMTDYAPIHAATPYDEATKELNRRTVRKLDFILLPFLALLFLFNSLDRSNIGNAETADFTKDIGLQPEDLNTAVAVFFAFFVALQPVGAALGRRYGMAVWVPSCMTIWGICTALHVWVKTKWQLILLRMVIGTLEAGFYPVTVSYLSLFYTRYEFAKRLGIFYGQYAVAGALGGLLAYGVFSRFPHNSSTGSEPGHWRSWQVLFLVEGGTTILLAMAGFLWLPHNANTAWFLRPDERLWAEERIRLDREGLASPSNIKNGKTLVPQTEENNHHSLSEESHGLLGSTSRPAAKSEAIRPTTNDRGLTRADVLSAFFDWKLWYLLVCNILSSMPVTAFSVFLPLVLRQLTNSPAHANLLTAPPFLVGAAVLYSFTYWSDKRKERLVPILWGLGLLAFGLTAVVILPQGWVILRYCALCMLMGGTFVASPLTVAWLTNNTPETGKRSVVLGVNGWGNLAGVFSSLLFQPRFAPSYRTPIFVTLSLILVSFAGFALFRTLIVRMNHTRQTIVSSWRDEDVEAERRYGTGPVASSRYGVIWFMSGKFGGERIRGWLHRDEGRLGDEQMTFVFGL